MKLLIVIFVFLGSLVWWLHSDVDEPVPEFPVVVELFTSQGCSSCPSADRLLSRLGRGEWKDRIIPLAFHVDYWNYLGWKDPFASQDFTQRQYRYGKKFELSSVYTPQAVIQGQAECVGSSEGDLREHVRALSVQPSHAEISVQNAVLHAGEFTASVTVRPDNDIAAEPLGLVVAVYENGLVTRVVRGENGGRELSNDFVVRQLQVIEAGRPAPMEWSVPLNIFLDSSWVHANLGVAVYLQNLKNFHIYTARIVWRPGGKIN
jgi:hypothetical protein